MKARKAGAQRVFSVCSRCFRRAEGVLYDDGVVGGFSRRNGQMERFFRDDEQVLCRDCLLRDPSYLREWGIGPD